MDRLCRKGVWNPVRCRPIPRIRDMTFVYMVWAILLGPWHASAKQLVFQIAAYDPFLPDDVFAMEGVERIREEKRIVCACGCSSGSVESDPGDGGIISYEKLRGIKSGAIFINTGRGGLVDEPGLVRALQDGIVGGAGLDVLMDEQPDMSNPLFQMENVCITPHIAYYSIGSDIDLRNGTCNQVIDALTCGMPEFILNRKELGISY